MKTRRLETVRPQYRNLFVLEEPWGLAIHTMEDGKWGRYLGFLSRKKGHRRVAWNPGAYAPEGIGPVSEGTEETALSSLDESVRQWLSGEEASPSREAGADPTPSSGEIHSSDALPKEGSK